MSDRVELAKVLYKEGAYCGSCEYAGWDTCADCRRCCIGYAAAAMLAGYSKRETVTEYAAGFRVTGEIYNFHRTSKEAQKFVDSLNAEGVDMVVMTREVLPQDASDWKPVGVADPLMGILGEIVQERRKALDATARDLLGIAPDSTGGLSVDEYMDEQRGRIEG